MFILTRQVDDSLLVEGNIGVTVSPQPCQHSGISESESIELLFRSTASAFLLSSQVDAAARSAALRPYSSAEPQCWAPFNSEWPMLIRP
jgi:hypothetical protein